MKTKKQKISNLTSFSDAGGKEEPDSKGKPVLNVTLSEVTTLSKLRKPEFYSNLKNTIIADSSYASLCLGDYLTSLYKAEELLTQPQLSGNHKYGYIFSFRLICKNYVSNFFGFLIDSWVTSTRLSPWFF